MSEYEVTSDGVTVWVNTPHGTIARFGRMGIDVHTEDTTACLHCTHGETTLTDWQEFQLQVAKHYGIYVGGEHAPTRFG